MPKRANWIDPSRSTKRPEKAHKTHRPKYRIERSPALTAAITSKVLNSESARRQSSSRTTDQDVLRQALTDFHGDLIAESAYVHLSHAMGLRSEQFEAAFRAGLSLMEKMRPRDPLERLALMQALLAHARAALLTIKLAGAQASELPVISEATERAAGTFARLMRAFDDHRQPRNSSATVSIGQANLGHQQIVQNVQIEEAGGKKNVDKQTRIQAKSPTIAIKTLPPHETGTQIPASDHPKITAMDEKQRSENPKRKIQGCEKRHETRPAVSGRRRASKTLASHD